MGIWGGAEHSQERLFYISPVFHFYITEERGLKTHE